MKTYANNIIKSLGIILLLSMGSGGLGTSASADSCSAPFPAGCESCSSNIKDYVGTVTATCKGNRSSTQLCGGELGLDKNNNLTCPGECTNCPTDGTFLNRCAGCTAKNTGGNNVTVSCYCVNKNGTLILSTYSYNSGECDGMGVTDDGQLCCQDGMGGCSINEKKL